MVNEQEIILDIENERYHVPTRLVVAPIEEKVLDFFYGKEVGPLAGVIGAALKITLSLILPQLAKAMKDVPEAQILPQPDIKSPAAKKDLLAYGVHYILALGTSYAALSPWKVVAAQTGKDHYVSGLTALSDVAKQEQPDGGDTSGTATADSATSHVETRRN